MQEDVLSLWDYVRIDEYQLPADTLTHALKGGVAGLWQRLRDHKAQAGTVSQVAEDLHPLPQSLLDRVAPAPDWRLAASSLSATLTTWLDQPAPALPALFIVGPPHNYNAHVLNLVAEAEGWTVLTPPTIDQLLSQDPSWLSPLRDIEGVWVLPALERCYLRHPRGLSLVRQLFAELYQGIPGRGVIGCDSWAWAYLDHVVPSMRPVALSAQALQAKDMAHWFYWLADQAGGGQYVFRQSNSGDYVLSPLQTDPDNTGDDVVSSPFLKHLAAYSRGIAGLAWELWRKRLRSAPENELAEAAENGLDSEGDATIWVLPWDEDEDPSPPDDEAHPEHILVLHGLLLHNGLTSEMLSHVLTLAPNSTTQALLELQDAGLIECWDTLWRISAVGYPSVRRWLSNAGYLCDDF